MVRLFSFRRLRCPRGTFESELTMAAPALIWIPTCTGPSPTKSADGRVAKGTNNLSHPEPPRCLDLPGLLMDARASDWTSSAPRVQAFLRKLVE